MEIEHEPFISSRKNPFQWPMGGLNRYPFDPICMSILWFNNLHIASNRSNIIENYNGGHQIPIKEIN